MADAAFGAHRNDSLLNANLELAGRPENGRRVNG
jgi:hypothetical protein